jgi:hypothetical protein
MGESRHRGFHGDEGPENRPHRRSILRKGNRRRQRQNQNREDEWSHLLLSSVKEASHSTPQNLTGSALRFIQPEPLGWPVALPAIHS